MSELGCAYMKFAKCETCNYITYRDCFNFRLWRTKFLLKEILPLKLTSEDQKIKGILGRVYFSVNEQRAKKFVASTAIYVDKQIKSITLAQALSMETGPGYEPTHKVYYIYCGNRVGDKEKVQSCLESFVDSLLLENCAVVVCAKPGVISCGMSWTNLDK